MKLNLFSGRTFNDASQYYIFPWIIQDYNSNELDLSKKDQGDNSKIFKKALKIKDIREKRFFRNLYKKSYFGSVKYRIRNSFVNLRKNYLEFKENNRKLVKNYLG